VIVGELHGTTEAPAAFSGLVCDAARLGPVTVALEFPETGGPAMHAFPPAPVEASPSATLLETPFWTRSLDRQDGRTSLAVLRMLQSVRLLKADGRDVTIRAFAPDHPPTPGFDQNYGELDMAAGLARAARDRPDARLLTLVGSFHAGKTRVPGRSLLPAAAHLPPGEVVSIYLSRQGGQSWSCTDECRAMDIPAREDDVSERGIIMRSVDGGLFDGVLALGPMTASPPASTAR